MKKIPAPPPTRKLFDAVNESELHQLIGGSATTASGQYLHWDELRHRDPPTGLSLENWWLSMKFARLANMQQLPMSDTLGKPFRYFLTPDVQRALHLIDSRAAGRIAMPEQVSESGPKERFMVRSLIEEAITSSQMEGASTTHKAAMDMFRSGRQPANKAERMIFNNLLGMTFIKKHKDDDLTPELVMEIHRTMTQGTLSENLVGRIQKPGDERVAVYSNSTHEILFEPPPAELLESRMQSMCDFANDANDGPFLHPVIRAIMLHFWLAYDHPFADGNGRTARALFYWSMLRNDYWLFEFIAISAILKKAQAQYGRAFQYVETDENDATYFINFQLEVIKRAVNAMKKYLAKKAREMGEAEQRFKASGEFNYRQLALLSHALRVPGAEYTVKSHSVSHATTANTARMDLRGLVNAGLLEERHPASGRKVIYVPAPNLHCE